VNLPAIRATIPDIVKARNDALTMMEEGAALLKEGYARTKEATLRAKAATRGHYSQAPLNTQGAEHLYNREFDAEKALVGYRKILDASIWGHLMHSTGMYDMMDKTAKDTFRLSLVEDVPEVTEGNVEATLDRLFSDSDMIFQRGLAKAFSKLDRRFKSHDPFRIGSRMILDRAFDEWGSWNGYRHHDDTLQDVERVFAVLDGEKPNFLGLRQAINDSRKGYGARQSEVESTYFRIKGFKNGNAHLWFTRADLLEKANKLLAEYYGPILPDGVSPGDPTPGTAVAKDLQFYRSPPAVVAALLRNLNFAAGDRILEPSCGDGAIIRELPSHTVIIGIEVDPTRAAYAGANCGNFLTMKIPQDFDYVLMNPPFYGTHWMDHVRKAFDCLKPGGRLRAVLPATAEVSESAKHVAFRAWATKVGKENYGRMWTDLPMESFAESGTRVQTVILEMRK